MLVINMICVAPIASGRNLALKMIQWTENLSKNQNIPLLTAETTGIASAKTFEKCGFSNIKELEYNNYVTSNDERPLANLEPNISCIIWEKINIIWDAHRIHRKREKRVMDRIPEIQVLDFGIVCKTSWKGLFFVSLSILSIFENLAKILMKKCLVELNELALKKSIFLLIPVTPKFDFRYPIRH